MFSAYSRRVACFVASSNCAHAFVFLITAFSTAYAASCVSFANRPIASPPSYEPLIKLFRWLVASSSDMSQNAEASAAIFRPLAARDVASSTLFPNPLNFAVREVIYPVKRVFVIPVAFATASSFFWALPAYVPMICSNAASSAATSAAAATHALPKSLILSTAKYVPIAAPIFLNADTILFEEL